MQIKSHWENITVLSKEMPLYVSVPENLLNPPAVIVLQEIFGVNSHIREVTDQIAQQGYLAVAPDVFHRKGDRYESGYDRVLEGQVKKQELIDSDFLSDIDFVFKWLNSQGATRVGSIGFCLGGRLAFLTATSKKLDCAVSFYGGGIAVQLLDLTQWIQCPIQLYFGGKDSIIPTTEIKQIEKKLKSLQKSFEIKVYPEAEHGFLCDQRGSFHPGSAEDAWAKVYAFLNQTLRCPIR